MKKLEVDANTKFDEETQDKILEEYLIKVKRKAFIQYLEGDGDVEKAIYAWALEFASAGVRKGKSISPVPKKDEHGNIEMKDGKPVMEARVHLTLELMPLRSDADDRRACVIPVQGTKIKRLSCTEPSTE